MIAKSDPDSGVLLYNSNAIASCLFQSFFVGGFISRPSKFVNSRKHWEHFSGYRSEIGDLTEVRQRATSFRT
jgi:hypothetical protein